MKNTQENTKDLEEKTMIEVPRMVTIAEAARITGLAEHFVRQLCLTGKITFVKAGKKFIVNLNKLVDYLDNPTTLSVTQ